MRRMSREFAIRLAVVWTLLRYRSDRGNHTAEYAIGVGAGVLITAGLYKAYKEGVADVISGWDF